MPVEFKVSRDAEVLDQYYTLREQCFQRELGLNEFDGSEEEQDRHGQLLLAVLNGRCVGGARISSHVPLPSQLEPLGLQQETCCTWERFVIDPSMRTVQLVRDFCQQLIEASRNCGYEHAMVLSSLRNARFYRRCHSALGVDFQIHRHVPHSAQGAFAGLEHYLSVAHLQDRRAMGIAV